MKKFILLFFLAAMAELGFAKGLNKDFKNEDAFKDYLIDNIHNLDPIEGIWKIHQKTELYSFDDNGNKLSPISLGVDVRLIIYKKGDRYISCVSEMGFIIWDQYEKGYEPYSYTFEKTAHNGKYLYNVIDQSSLEEGYAYINQNDIRIYRKKNDNGIIQECTLTGTKLSPNSLDIANALKVTSKPIEPTQVTGTAFAISSDGFIATAYHVIDGMARINVKGINGDFKNSYNCIIVSIDKTNDIAILRVDKDYLAGFDNIPYSFRSSKTKVGESVFCLGYPLMSSMGSEVKLTNGIISANSGYGGDTSELQISVPIQPGNSGGPLIDQFGNLIGVVVAKHTIAENASYAIKAGELKKLLQQQLPFLPSLSLSSRIASKDLPSKVSVIKNYVYIIEASK